MDCNYRYVVQSLQDCVITEQSLLTALSATLLPSVYDVGKDLFPLSGTSIWLYCQVKDYSSSLTVIWMKDNGTLLQRAPKLLIRRPLLIYQRAAARGSSTSLLAMEDVQSSESGTYQCIARDGMAMAISSTLSITGTLTVYYYGIY